MATADTLSIILLLAAVPIGFAAWIVIYSRKRWQAQHAAEEVRRKEEDQRREVEQEAMRRAEEDERQRRGAERRQIEEELQKVEEERHRAEEERKHLDEEARREMEEARRKTEVQRRTEELRKAEEERRKGEEEQKRHEADESQRKAEEEARREAEKLQRLEEETRRKGEEAQLKSEEEQHLKGESESRHVELSKRGGRPRDSTQEGKKQRGQETKSPHPKPEIGCWKRERQWILGVEVPEDLLEKPGLQVLQNWSPLTPDEGVDGCWLLQQAHGDVIVRWNQDAADKETRLRVGEGNYLLFRLSGQNRNQGRCVKSPSSGWYLVTVPENCERDEALSGPPPVKPEPVSITGYRAHLFVLEKDGYGKIAFRIPGDKSVVIESKAPRFALAGTRLNDASEDRGPLFGQKPPQIHALDEQAWKDVETIVVGEEGSGKSKWRTAFSPVQGLIEQDLPSEVVARNGGWYFLRFYDANDDLMESLDLRFVRGLKDIKVHQPSPLPSDAGHATVSVELFHEPGCCIQPACGLEGSLQIEHEDDKTILTIPADPTSDETRWLVGPQDGPQVEVTILVERLWWDVGEEDTAPSHWEDQLLILSRSDFTATSKKALWLLLPRRRWVDGVFVGFEQPKARSYTAKVMERAVAIPLRDFGDSKEVGDCTQKYLLKIWIKCDDRVGEKVIAIIPAEPPVIDRQDYAISRLNLAKISAPRLASVLAGLRKVTGVPLRALIKEVHHEHPKRRAARRVESVEFVKKALCVIGLSLELGGEDQSQILALKNRWAVRARRARDEFPEVMSQLRNRYEKLKTCRSH